MLLGREQEKEKSLLHSTRRRPARRRADKLTLAVAVVITAARINHTLLRRKSKARARDCLVELIFAESCYKWSVHTAPRRRRFRDQRFHAIVVRRSLGCKTTRETIETFLEARYRIERGRESGEIFLGAGA